MGYYPDWEFESDEIDVTDLPARMWPHLGGCGVYRLYNASDTMIYVGQSDAPYLRFQAHRRKAWWPGVCRKTVVWYRTPTEAESVETLAILTQQPVYNTRRDKPMPIVRGTSPRDWIHMVPEWTFYRNTSRIQTILEHGLQAGVAQDGTGKCLAIFVSLDDWHERGCDALGEPLLAI